jgi:hypothetical protein
MVTLKMCPLPNAFRTVNNPTILHQSTACIRNIIPRAMTTQQKSDAAALQQLSSTSNILELNETVTRIASHPGVEVVQILNLAGNIIAESSNIAATNSDNNNSASSSDDDGTKINTTSASTAIAARKLLNSALLYVQALDATTDDEISFVQIRSKNGRELMIAPHSGFALVVLKRY